MLKTSNQILFNFVDKLAICPWWVNVPLNTTLDDIVWIKDDGTQTKPKSDTIEVKSSDGSSKYIIRKVDNKYHCSCLSSPKLPLFLINFIVKNYNSGFKTLRLTKVWRFPG